MPWWGWVWAVVGVVGFIVAVIVLLYRGPSPWLPLAVFMAALSASIWPFLIPPAVGAGIVIAIGQYVLNPIAAKLSGKEITW